VDGTDAPKGLFHYIVTYQGTTTLQVSIVGIDISEHCGPQSNIDLVYFVWENFLRFSYKKYALALTPRDSEILPDLLFLKHYRTESDGWKDSGKCPNFIGRNQEILLPFHECDLSDSCTCRICTRHPPSLADPARHVLFNYSLHIDRFRFRTEKT